MIRWAFAATFVVLVGEGCSGRPLSGSGTTNGAAGTASIPSFPESSGSAGAAGSGATPVGNDSSDCAQLSVASCANLGV